MGELIARIPNGILLIFVGMSGSGKSRFSELLAQYLRAAAPNMRVKLVTFDELVRQRFHRTVSATCSGVPPLSEFDSGRWLGRIGNRAWWSRQFLFLQAEAAVLQESAISAMATPREGVEIWDLGGSVCYIGSLFNQALQQAGWVVLFHNPDRNVLWERYLQSWDNGEPKPLIFGSPRYQYYFPEFDDEVSADQYQAVVKPAFYKLVELRNPLYRGMTRNVIDVSNGVDDVERVLAQILLFPPNER